MPAKRRSRRSAQRQDFGILLNLAFSVFRRSLEAHLAAAGFHDLGPSFGYVFRLLEPEPANLRVVADRLGITPQGALKLINDMVARGYVERRADPEDGRIKYLLLTERARQALASARRFHAAFERDLGERIGPDMAKAGRQVLEDIVMQCSEPHLQSARPL